MEQNKDNKLSKQQENFSKKHINVWKEENQRVIQEAKERQLRAKAYEAEWAKQQQKNKE